MHKGIDYKLLKADGFDPINKNKFPTVGDVQRGTNSTKDLTMPTSGTVKWFNNAKGFGFILPEGGGEDLFAHYSSIEMEGYKTLKAGQAVVFDVVKGDKGMHATHIRVADADQAENDADSAPSQAQIQKPETVES